MPAFTQGRTVSRETWEAAQESWRGGAPWADEWRPWRREAGQAGIIFAPIGTRNDRAEDRDPSQRAIVYRAMIDTPDLLHEAIRRSRGSLRWGKVVGFLLERLGESAAEAEREEEFERGRREGPTKPQAIALLGRIIEVADETRRAKIVQAMNEGRCPTCGRALGDQTR